MPTKLQNGGVHVLSADPTRISRLGSLGHPGSQEDWEVGEDRGSSRKSWKWDFREDWKVQEVREVNEVLVVQNKRELWEARAKTQASVEPVNLGRSSDIIFFQNHCRKNDSLL